MGTVVFLSLITKNISMGEHKVSVVEDENARKHFIDHLLKDIEALERMLQDGKVESGITRIGAEQELCLVDHAWSPLPINLKVLEKINDDHFTTELAKFNMEINLDPILFEGNALSTMEKDIRSSLSLITKAAKPLGGTPLLTGILPTIKSTDLGENMMTPISRYQALSDIMRKYRGGEFEFRIEGTDELIARHDSVMFESCNTSFQIHYQVSPKDFVHTYNWAQMIAAPAMAIAVNSPLLFGKRLWQETRIALFQQSVDIRSANDLIRERSPRVSFGTKWADHSIVEVFKEDIVRYKILLSNLIENDSLKQLAQGEVPTLDALRVHNSTIYKWNRPCVGSADGVAHIRIENRLLPAGPTVLDQMANAAFWFGLMSHIPEPYKSVKDNFEFDDAKSNLLSAVRHGADIQIKWMNGKKYLIKDIVLNELLPIAREGLKNFSIHSQDIDKYLGIIEDRVKSGQTGASWVLKSYDRLKKEGSKDEALVAITAAMHYRQLDGVPVHNWELAKLDEAGSWVNYYWRVDQIMSTDLFAVQEGDFIDLVGSIMDWRNVRHVPVENPNGELVGLVTSGILVKYLFETRHEKTTRHTIKEIMIRNPHCISPEALTKDALTIMSEHNVGCLPVVKEKKLVGIITEHDFVDISKRLISELGTTDLA